jgi:hypothetical protein
MKHLRFIAKLISTHRTDIAHNLLHPTFLIVMWDHIVTLPEGRAASLHCLSFSATSRMPYRHAMKTAKAVASSRSV